MNKHLRAFFVGVLWLVTTLLSLILETSISAA